MVNFLQDVVLSFLTLLLSTILLYFAGHIAYSFVKQENVSQEKLFFVKMVIGMFMLVTFYAIYSTSFLTIYSALVIILLGYILSNQNRFTIKIKLNILKLETGIYPYLIVALFLISFSFSFLFHFDTRLFVHSDISFYASIANSFHTYGIETLNTDPFIYGDISADMYHYFNEWLVAFFMNVSESTSLGIFLSLVLPLLNFVVFAGAWAFTKKTVPNQSVFYSFFVSFAFLLIPGFLSYVGNVLVNHSLIASYSILQGGIEILKVKIILILLLLYLLNDADCFEDKNFFALTLIPLVWPTQIPAFVGGYVLWIAYSFFKKRAISWKMLIQWFLPIICVFVYLIIFNLKSDYEQYHQSFSDTDSYGVLSYLLDTYNSPKTIGKYLVLYALPAFILFVFIVVYEAKIRSFFERNRIARSIIQKTDLLIVFILIAIYVSYGLLNELFNARQIVSNFIYPLFNVLIFLIVIEAFEKGLKIRYFVLISTYSFILFTAVYFRPQLTPDRNRLKIMETLKEKNRESYLVAVDVIRENRPLYMYKKLYADLLMYDEDFKPVNLNLFPSTILRKPADKLEYYGSVSKQTFYRYVKQNNLLGDVETAKLQFLNEFKFDYLLISSSLLANDSCYVHQLKMDTILTLEKNINLIVLEK